ncbi:MAG: hypothetical protein KC609_13160 [Myxococcales bacterium]|nr:hypothetical protein [Myxococcales bacterium]
MSAKCPRCASSETERWNTIGREVTLGSLRLTTEGPAIVELRRCAACGFNSLTLRQANSLEQPLPLAPEVKEAANG